jgi:hypothetical protein
MQHNLTAKIPKTIDTQSLDVYNTILELLQHQFQQKALTIGKINY